MASGCEQVVIQEGVKDTAPNHRLVYLPELRIRFDGAVCEPSMGTRTTVHSNLIDNYFVGILPMWTRFKTVFRCGFYHKRQL